MQAAQDALGRLKATWRRQREEMDAWVAANPVLARAWDEAVEEGEARKRAAQARASMEWQLQRAGTPARLMTILMGDGLRETPAVRAVRDWMDGERTFLVLTGGTGAGKTLAACQALGRGGLFERAVAAGRLGLYGDDDVARMRSLRRAKVLVLDDLGAEFAGDVWRAQFDELVDERYGQQRRTVITTNLSPEALRERYGARVVDRLRHDGLVVACGSESLRKPGGGR